jgi:hypothetical protein
MHQGNTAGDDLLIIESFDTNPQISTTIPGLFSSFCS